MTATPSTPLLVLRPGDNVLVSLTEDLDGEQIQDMAAKLRKSFPGVDFTIMTGVAGILVQPPA